MCPTRLGVGPPRAESSNGTEATGSPVRAEIARRTDAIRHIRTPLPASCIRIHRTVGTYTDTCCVSIRVLETVNTRDRHRHRLVRESDSVPQIGLQGVIREVVRLKFAQITRGTGAMTRPFVSQLTLTLAG